MFAKHIVKVSLVVLFLSLTVNSNTLLQDSEPEYALSPNATLEEVITALETAHDQYETLYIHITEYDPIHGSVMTEEVWLSQTQGAYRRQFTSTSADGEVFTSFDISDGEYAYTSRYINGEPMVTMMLIEPAYVAKTLGLVTTVIAPEVVAKILADRTAHIEVAGVEMVDSRETIKVSYASEWRLMNLWVDRESGILFQHELGSPEGELVRTVTVDVVEFNPVFEDPETLFFVDRTAYDLERIRSIWSQLEIPFTGDE